MASFTDNKGRSWQIDVDVYSAEQVEKACSVDLLELFNSNNASTLLADPRKLVNVVYVLCREQADDQSVSDRDFGKAMVGNALGGAADALLDAVADFFPSSKRATMKLMVARSKITAGEIQARQLKALREMPLPQSLDATASRASSALTSAVQAVAV